MENKISELANRIEYLEKLINVIQNNVNFSLGLTWAILAVVVATSGLALYNLSKIWVNKRVEQELDKKLDIIKNNILDDMKQYMYKHPEFLIYNFKISVNQYKTFIIEFKECEHINPNFSLDCTNKLEVYSPLSNRKISFDVNIKGSCFTFILKDYDRAKDGEDVICTLVLLNKNYILNNI